MGSITTLLVPFQLSVCAKSIAVITLHCICTSFVADAAQHLIVHNLLLILLSTLLLNCSVALLLILQMISGLS